MKFTVDAEETVFYRFEVEAENEEEARLEAENYPVSSLEIHCTRGFRILSVEAL